MFAIFSLTITLPRPFATTNSSLVSLATPLRGPKQSSHLDISSLGDFSSLALGSVSNIALCSTAL